MYKIAFLIAAISLIGCTTYKEYAYFTGSVLANDENTSDVYDTVLITAIKPGYYCRILQNDAIENTDYNEMEWIFVSAENKVKLFTTANYEYCLQDMHWKQQPKQIYQQIKRNQEKFDSLYFDCSNQAFAPSGLSKLNNWIIYLGPQNDVIHREELLFVKDGLWHKIRDYRQIVSIDKYAYIGK